MIAWISPDMGLVLCCVLCFYSWIHCENCVDYGGYIKIRGNRRCVEHGGWAVLGSISRLERSQERD